VPSRGRAVFTNASREKSERVPHESAAAAQRDIGGVERRAARNSHRNTMRRALLMAAALATVVRGQDAAVPTAFKFYTKTDLTLCMWSTTDPVTQEAVLMTEDKLKTALMAEFSVEAYQMENEAGGVTKVAGAPSCQTVVGDPATNAFDGEEFHVQIFNEPTDSQSASAIASGHVNKVYGGVSEFLERTALATDVPADRLFLSSLGFVVTFPDQAIGAAAVPIPATAQGIQTLGGTEVFWPWWAWLLYAALLVVCFIPLCVCVVRRRRVVEDDEEEDFAVEKQRMEEGLQKIYGPEWGMTEVDFDGEPDAMDDAIAIQFGEESKKVPMYTSQRMIPNSQHSGSDSLENAANAAWEAEVGQGGGRRAKGHVSRFDIDEELGMDEDGIGSFDLGNRVVQ
jgi:hypothetical protein